MTTWIKPEETIQNKCRKRREKRWDSVIKWVYNDCSQWLHSFYHYHMPDIFCTHAFSFLTFCWLRVLICLQITSLTHSGSIMFSPAHLTEVLQRLPEIVKMLKSWEYSGQSGVWELLKTKKLYDSFAISIDQINSLVLVFMNIFLHGVIPLGLEMKLIQYVCNYLAAPVMLI